MAATCLTWTSGGDQLVVTSRAARSVVWVDTADGEPAVVKTLQDSRMKDPICAQDTHTSVGEASTAVRTVVIADFEAGLHSYRHGDAG